MKIIREMGKGVACLLLAVAAGPVGAQTVEYIHTDALGTPVAVTNSAGAVVERSEYEPYGALLNRPITDGPGFTGHVQDAATGLTYMQQRYFDPQIGRFLSADPVTAESNSGALFNRYLYAANNPYRFYDPDGRCTGSRIENADNTCKSTGEHTTQERSAKSLDARSVNKVFSHSSVSSSNAGDPPQESSMPVQTKSALRKFLGTKVGGAVGRYAVKNRHKINMIQILPKSGFEPDYSGGFDLRQGGNYVSYSLLVAEYMAGRVYSSELAGAGLDTLLAHEIGHTPLAASALGIGVNDSSDWGEINVVRYLGEPVQV